MPESPTPNPQPAAAVTPLAPDVGALVEYGRNGFNTGPGLYRVSSWLRAAPPPQLDPDDFLGEILYEACQEVRDASDGKKKRMQFCLREEATHLSLTGICGASAPIKLCKVTGMVNWSDELLAESRASAQRRGAAHEMIF